MICVFRFLAKAIFITQQEIGRIGEKAEPVAGTGKSTGDK